MNRVREWLFPRGIQTASMEMHHQIKGALLPRLTQDLALLVARYAASHAVLNEELALILDKENWSLPFQLPRHIEWRKNFGDLATEIRLPLPPKITAAKTASVIKDFSYLTKLIIPDSWVPSSDLLLQMQALKGQCPRLTTLRFERTFPVVTLLRDFPHVRSLEMSYRVTVNEMRELGNSSSAIHSLSLLGWALPAAETLPVVATFSSLTSLDISGMSLSDSLTPLKALTTLHLTHLTVRECFSLLPQKNVDTVCSILSTLPLTYLDIRGCCLLPQGLAQLLTLTSLTTLYCGDATLTRQPATGNWKREKGWRRVARCLPIAMQKNAIISNAQAKNPRLQVYIEPDREFYWMQCEGKSVAHLPGDFIL